MRDFKWPPLLWVAGVIAGFFLLGYSFGHRDAAENPPCKEPSYTELVKGNPDHFRQICSNGVIK